VNRPFIHTCTIQLRGLVGANDYNELVYAWVDEQGGVECRFGLPKGKAAIMEGGEIVAADLTVLLPHTVTLLENERRIVTTQVGFTGTYDIAKVRPIPWRDGIHHYEADLLAVESADVLTAISGGAAATVFAAYLDGGSA